jgi:hypothetical protein
MSAKKFLTRLGDQGLNFGFQADFGASCQLRQYLPIGRKNCFGG